VNPLDLVGKKVRYKGREGKVSSLHAGRDRPPALTIMFRVPIREPDRFIDVPESDWGELEILSD
jgi:hypothetical protein